jgi:hypothetical protein
MGNIIYAIVRAVERPVYTHRGRRCYSRTERRWHGGVVARSGLGEVEIRGFAFGCESKTLAEAKNVALCEAGCVGRAIVDIAAEHGVEV